MSERQCPEECARKLRTAGPGPARPCSPAAGGGGSGTPLPSAGDTAPGGVAPGWALGAAWRQSPGWAVGRRAEAMVPKDTETERRWIWTGCSWRGPSHCVCNTALPQQRMHNQIKNRQTNKAATLPATVCIWIQTKLSSIILSLPLKTCWEKWFLWSTCTCSEGSSRSGFHRPRETSLDDINLRLVKPHLTSAPVPMEPNQSHRLNASGLSLLLYRTPSSHSAPAVAFSPRGGPERSALHRPKHHIPSKHFAEPRSSSEWKVQKNPPNHTEKGWVFLRCFVWETSKCVPLQRWEAKVIYAVGMKRLQILWPFSNISFLLRAKPLTIDSHHSPNTG